MQNLKNAKNRKKTFKKSKKIRKIGKSSKREDEIFRRKISNFSEKNSLSKNWATIKAEFEEFGLQRERRRALSSRLSRQFFAKRKIRQKSPIFGAKFRRNFARARRVQDDPRYLLENQKSAKKFSFTCKKTQKSAKKSLSNAKKHNNAP